MLATGGLIPAPGCRSKRGGEENKEVRGGAKGKKGEMEHGGGVTKKHWTDVSDEAIS